MVEHRLTDGTVHRKQLVCAAGASALARCVLILSGALVGLAANAQSPRILGTVVAGKDDQPISHVEVSMQGGGHTVKQLTTDSGKFVFPLQPPLKVGFVISFQVSGWVVTEPFMLGRGRLYAPDPDAEPVRLRVLRRGDRGLKSSASLAHLVEAQFARFDSKDQANAQSLSFLEPGSMESSAALQLRTAQAGTMNGQVSSVLTAVGYRPVLSTTSDLLLQDAESGKSKALDTFLVMQAAELGFTAEELRIALDEWSRSATDTYYKGLAALYKFDYAQASRYISQSLSLAGANLIERYVPLAYAELEQAHYPAAEAALRKVLAVHPDDPLLLHNLGVVLRQVGRYTESESLLTKAFALDELSAATADELAELYHDEGKYDKAEPLFKRALVLDLAAHGADHPYVAIDLCNFGTFELDRGKYKEAESYLNSALSIAEKSLGREDPLVATILSGLSALYGKLRRQEQAESALKRALQIDQTALPPDHPNLSRELNNLAGFYSAQKKYAEAELLFERALQIEEKALGPQHPNVARTLVGLAVLHLDQGKYTDAELNLEKALFIANESLGPQHPLVATILSWFSRLYREQGKQAQAESPLKRALDINEAALGPNHPEVATMANNLGVLYRDQGKYGEAEPLFKQALEICEKRQDESFLAVVLNNLAMLYFKSGKYAEAEPVLRRLLALCVKLSGPESADVAANAANLADVLDKLGRHEEAKHYRDIDERIRAKEKPQE